MDLLVQYIILDFNLKYLKYFRLEVFFNSLLILFRQCPQRLLTSGFTIILDL